jgi:hypothetical protein
MKDGYSNTCKRCKNERNKVYYTQTKKTDSEDLRLEFSKVYHQISVDAEDFDSKLDTLRELYIKIQSIPTSVFSISVAGFGEKSSIADSIVLSRMPLFLNRELKVIVNPQEVKVEWSADSSAVKVHLPEQIKLTKQQITSLNQFLLS